jgi:hypothetical protein
MFIGLYNCVVHMLYLVAVHFAVLAQGLFPLLQKRLFAESETKCLGTSDLLRLYAAILY